MKQKLINKILLSVIVLFSCLNANSDERAASPYIAKFYTQDVSKYAFTHSVQQHSNEEEDFRILGKSFFTKPWVEAPTATTARDGLGPLFSANKCLRCHPNNGAGLAQNRNGEIHPSLVMRLSIFTDKNIHNDISMRDGFIPEPTYGGQLSINGTSGVKYEGKVKLSYKEKKGHYSDGDIYILHVPEYKIKDLNYGPFHKNTNVAPHIALALIGLGAIENIPVKEILEFEDINDSDGDGISGKANWVYDPETKKIELGRFRWKAAVASVKDQAGNAAHNDMSLTNPLYPNENCTPSQTACLNVPKGLGGKFDFPQERLDAIAYYLKTLKIPVQRKSKNFEKGREIFQTIGCAKCHRENFNTPKYGTIYPYSDFLLHDMGKELSDGHRMFLAEPNEFRTPPLWGLGLYKKVSGSLNLLHDGRAKSIAEAILWHGGEAQTQKEAFKHLSKQQRKTLIEFLKGI